MKFSGYVHQSCAFLIFLVSALWGPQYGLSLSGRLSEPASEAGRVEGSQEVLWEGLGVMRFEADLTWDDELGIKARRKEVLVGGKTGEKELQLLDGDELF